MEAVLPEDLQRDVGLAKRRHAELCRQRRVFNARTRLIGGDTQAWDVQVQNRKIKEATEKARHETFAAEMRHNDKIACILQDRERRDKKQLCRAITDFQQNFQKLESRREFDLSDPMALKKDLPARLSDNDVRNTISGMQKFMGEDLNFEERRRVQKEQNREWSLQQQREWERARAEHRLAEDLHTQARLQFDETARHLQKLDRSTRKAVCAAVGEFNKKQAAESAERKRQERQQEQADNLAEICSLLCGDLLSENRQQAASSFGPHRVVPDRWKGMNQEQLEEIRFTQKQQIQEKLLQEEEHQRNLYWDRCRIQKDHSSLLHERQQQRLQRDLRRALDCSNLSLAREQHSRKKQMDEASTSQPNEDYFSQFNTRSRTEGLSLQWRCQPGAFLQSSEGGSSQFSELLTFLGGLWWVTSPSLCPLFMWPFCVCLCPDFPFPKDTNPSEIGSTLIRLHANS
ncbi:RIB43A-like with coiled-coils protein 2 isoform X1 [Nannospalax galili]|uniref:RIB43A-like with coiled-coils protein 2 isoform X1 n=1 Tax=Nannospalax galili TaxID=1026970 RepID=UPI00111C4F57|nr:RIB43A-like with coiled-coils protein 2 isoform X1 [Nannospalax galili]